MKVQSKEVKVQLEATLIEDIVLSKQQLLKEAENTDSHKDVC
jgi:hypothetical protein